MHPIYTAEWEKRQQAVIDGNVTGTKQPKKGKASNARTEAPPAAVGPTARDLQDFKGTIVRGAIKYRTLARWIIAQVKKYPENMRVVSNGSHFNLHWLGGGATLVRPHGRKAEVSGSTASALMSQIQRLLSAQKP